MDTTTIVVCAVMGLAILNGLMGRGFARIGLNLLGGLVVAVLVLYGGHRFWPEKIDGPCKWTTTNLQKLHPDSAKWLRETSVCQKET